jgi:hypothetical protein
MLKEQRGIWFQTPRKLAMLTQLKWWNVGVDVRTLIVLLLHRGYRSNKPYTFDRKIGYVVQKFSKRWKRLVKATKILLSM